MNWRQYYTTIAPEDRIELLAEMLRKIERRQRRLLLVRGRIIRDRRQAQRWHYINDRRQAESRWRRAIYITSFAAILIIISTATWLISLNIPPLHGVLLVIIYDLALLSLLFFKPYRRPQPSY